MNELIEATKIAQALRWWEFSQNNSGGSFIVDDMVAEEVFIQALTAKEAIAKADEIFTNGRDSFCSCCGERWSTWGKDDTDGTVQPEIYGHPIWEQGPGIFRNEARLHYWDGSVETYKFGDPVPARLA